MSAPARIRQWQRQARLRQAAVIAAVALPAAVGLFLLVQRAYGTAWAAIAASLLAALSAYVAWRQAAAMDARWLVRQLDARESGQENSSDLLLRENDGLNTLQQLQKQRIERRLLQRGGTDLRRPWPKLRLALAWLAGAAMAAAALYWPAVNAPVSVGDTAVAARAAAAKLPVKLLSAQLRIAAPAYTGLLARTENGLTAKFPEGARLQWQLRFQPQPQSARLVFFDGTRVPLQDDGGVWRAARTLAESDVYRVEVDGVPLPAKWQRLDAIKDRAPELRVRLPERSLSLVSAGQRHWRFEFEADDDYGLGAAMMEIQLAQGSGENIQFKAWQRPLAGQGGTARKRYAGSLDLADLGMQAGDDLIVQFRVGDRRQPVANLTASAGYILRWPVEDAYEASGVEGLLKKVVPAYFRSQRQIIIDTEKLLAEKSRLSRDTFEVRSDTIGVDQRLLRLRYGQFLGEESEGGREAPAGADASGGDAADGHGHADEPPQAKADAGTSQSVLEQFGHTHDIAEAATLLDPETRTLLRAALNEMWQAELHLRTAEPKKALPFEYRALGFIKKVQQASRIYLARVGPELPPIDESRRLGGDRGGIGNPADSLTAATPEDAPVLAFWQALDDAGAGPPDYAALRTWLAAHPDRVPDALGLKVALAALQSAPDCGRCRDELKALLWPVVPKPPAVPKPRALPRGNGKAYSDALREERRP